MAQNDPFSTRYGTLPHPEIAMGNRRRYCNFSRYWPLLALLALLAVMAIIDSYTLLWPLFCTAGTGFLRVSYVYNSSHNRPYLTRCGAKRSPEQGITVTRAKRVIMAVLALIGAARARGAERVEGQGPASLGFSRGWTLPWSSVGTGGPYHARVG